MAATLVFAVPAFAGGSTLQSGYSHTPHNVAGTVATKVIKKTAPKTVASTSPAVKSAGTLPFTGLDLGVFAVAALALAGLGPLRVAAARLLASLALALIVTAVAMVALLLRARIEHPEHAALGIAAYAVTYLAIGSIVGAFVRDPLTGSMAVMFVFLIDTFSGPGMGQSAIPTVSTYPARLLMAAGAGGASSTSDWALAVVTIVVALCLAAGTFWLAARAR